jgi:hypothetical protein
VSELFRFPNPVNEVSGTVAGGVLLMGLAAWRSSCHGCCR